MNENTNEVKETKEENKGTAPANETVKGSEKKESTDAEVKAEKPTDKETKEEKEVKTDNNETVEALRAELTAITEKAERIPTLEQELATAKQSAENQQKVITEYEALVTKLVETKMSQVPSEYKDLIPNNLTLAQRLDWLDKAESKGLFKQEKQNKPNVEIGKPLNVEQAQADTSKLSASSLLRMAYNTVKPK